VRTGRPLNWRWHCARLAADCVALRLPLPDCDLLRAEIARVAPADATVKVILTRGTSTRGYAIAEGIAPRRIVSAFPPPGWPESRARDGVAVRRCALTLAAQPRLAGAKTLNRLENVLARSEWHDPGIAEGLLGDAHGHVVEGTMSNLFVVHGGEVATPRLDRCGVVGAQRERVRELLGACVERDVRWEELEAADELFLTNSLIGAWPVARFNGRGYRLGPVVRRVQDAIAQDDARA
jgi:4-amino-4-deoxychorismate lyase